MTRKKIEKQYNKLVSEIEEKIMYDGRGTVNRYICAEIIGFDILWHIEQKIKYNELRPYKHGGLVY